MSEAPMLIMDGNISSDAMAYLCQIGRKYKVPGEYIYIEKKNYVVVDHFYFAI